MPQQTLAMASGFEQYAKKTRRALFLEELEQVVPWAQLCRLIEPHYPKAGKGRPPVGLERMLRVYFLQPWFNLSDPGLEEALYDSVVMRQFVGIDLGREPVPDETTVCKFPSPPGRARLGRGDSADGEPVFTEPGSTDHDRHHRRCDHPSCSQFDQEPGAEARPRDAPNEEGQAVVCVTNMSASS